MKDRYISIKRIVWGAGFSLLLVAGPVMAQQAFECNPYSGTARGLCQAGYVISCDQNPNTQSCQNVSTLFFQDTGTPAPWIPPVAVDCNGQDHCNVFVTSDTYDGNLGGLQGADDKCNYRAGQAELPGTYKAWASTTGDGGMSPSDRFVHATVPYTLVNGDIVADDYTDLTDGSLMTGIYMDETGATERDDGDSYGVIVYTRRSVRTGTTEEGTAFFPSQSGASNCNNFTSGEVSTSGGGTTIGKYTDWSASSFIDCETRMRLYCFQQ